MVSQPHEDQLPRGAGHTSPSRAPTTRSESILETTWNAASQMMRSKRKPNTWHSPEKQDISEQREKHKELNCSVHVKMLAAGLTNPSHIYYTHGKAEERQILLQPIRIRPSAQDPIWNHLTTNKLLFQICHLTFPWRALMYSNNICSFRLGVGLFSKRQRLEFETRSSAHLSLPRCWSSSSTENYMLCCKAKIKSVHGYYFSLT